MIRQSTVLAMAPIAIELANKGINISENVGDMIKGLNEASLGLAQYTDETVAVDLPENTKENTEHSDIQSVIYPSIAAVIRSSLGVISKNVKPILVRADELIRQSVGTNSNLDAILQHVRIDMTNMEPEFLVSSMCPSTIPPSFANAPNIKTGDMVVGNWPVCENAEELVDMIRVDHPALYTFFSNPEEIREVYNNFFANKYFWAIFDSRSRDGDLINVLNQNHYKFSSFRAMVILSLLVNKFRSMDTPFAGVMGVSLEDYRVNLNLLRDLTNTILARFRALWLERAKAGLVILDDDTEFKAASYGVLEGLPVIQGTIRIGYNNAMLDVFAENEEESIIDYAIGYVYARQRGYNVKDVVTDRDVIVNAMKEYCGDVNTFARGAQLKIAIEAVQTATREFSAKPENQAVLDLIKIDVPAANKISVAINKEVDLRILLDTPSFIDDIAKNEASLMSSPLAVTLAGVFGSPIAAEILKSNLNSGTATQEQQRKRLTGSIVSAIINRLV